MKITKSEILERFAARHPASLRNFLAGVEREWRRANNVRDDWRLSGPDQSGVLRWVEDQAGGSHRWESDMRDVTEDEVSTMRDLELVKELARLGQAAALDEESARLQKEIDDYRDKARRLRDGRDS